MRGLATNLFAPDAVMPSQMTPRPGSTRALRGEQALMLAVLNDAIDCCQRFALARSHEGRARYEDARAWIESTDVTWPFSYENICAALGFDAEAIRDALVRPSEGRKPRRSRLTPKIVSVVGHEGRAVHSTRQRPTPGVRTVPDVQELQESSTRRTSISTGR